MGHFFSLLLSSFIFHLCIIISLVNCQHLFDNKSLNIFCFFSFILSGFLCDFMSNIMNSNLRLITLFFDIKMYANDQTIQCGILNRRKSRIEILAARFNRNVIRRKIGFCSVRKRKKNNRIVSIFCIGKNENEQNRT